MTALTSLKARKLGLLGAKAATSNTPISPKHVVPAGGSIVKANVNSAARNAQRDISLASRHGAGTMLDLPISAIRSLPGINKIVTKEKYKNTLKSYQSKVVSADRKAGDYLASKGKMMRSMFTTDDLLPRVSVTTGSGSVVDAYVPTQVARLSAPVDKIKPFAVPMLATLGVDSIYDNIQESKQQSQQDEEGDQTVKNAAELREQLINKIAETVTTINEEHMYKVAALKAAEKINMVMEKVNTASEMLKQAHVKIASLENSVDSLTESNKHLKLQILADERSNRAIKLAKDMFRRGMIKQADIQEQTDYIIGLTDESYETLSKTVENVPLKHAGDVQKGLDKVSYIVEVGDDELSKPNLGDAIVAFAKQI